MEAQTIANFSYALLGMGILIYAMNHFATA
jgi:hypothetical protein